MMHDIDAGVRIRLVVDPRGVLMAERYESARRQLIGGASALVMRIDCSAVLMLPGIRAKRGSRKPDTMYCHR